MKPAAIAPDYYRVQGPCGCRDREIEHCFHVPRQVVRHFSDGTVLLQDRAGNVMAWPVGAFMGEAKPA